jgi:long-subunit fatty acid transport protein
VFQQDPSSINSARDISQEAVRQVDITGYGVSGSYRVTPLLAVGASLTAYSFKMDSTFRRRDTDGFFGPPLTTVTAGSTSTQTGDDTAWAPTLGVMIGRDALRFGAVYRHGASFDMTSQGALVGTRMGLFRVPDTLAFGASARIVPPLTVAVEITRVWYSRLREDFVTDSASGSGRSEFFDIDDATEIHGGVQYAVPRWPGVPRFRGGLWYDPDHSVNFTPSTLPSDRLFNERFSAALSTGRNQLHVTGGIGLTFGRHLEFNVAFDAAPTTNIFSSSLIVR